MELFIQAVHKYNALEKIPVKLGAKHDLYHSERHLIDRIGGRLMISAMGIVTTAGSLVFALASGELSAAAGRALLGLPFLEGPLGRALDGVARHECHA